MKSKTPIGLKILTIMVLLANLGAIQSLFDSNATIIVGNFFFTGISVKLYYAVMIPLGIVTAYGLWTLKRCTTQTEQLVKTGPYQVSATAQPGRGLQNNINTAADRAADTRDRSPALRSER